MHSPSHIWTVPPSGPKRIAGPETGKCSLGFAPEKLASNTVKHTQKNSSVPRIPVWIFDLLHRPYRPSTYSTQISSVSGIITISFSLLALAVFPDPGSSGWLDEYWIEAVLAGPCQDATLPCFNTNCSSPPNYSFSTASGHAMHLITQGTSDHKERGRQGALEIAMIDQ